MQNPTPHTPQYELVAQINKTRGLDGQLVAQESGGLSVLYPGLEVWIVPPVCEGVRHTTVVEVQDDFKKHGVLIRLKGVADRTQATRLIGRYLLAHSEQIDTATQLLDYGFDEGSEEVAPSSPREHSMIQEGALFLDTFYGILGRLDSIKPGPAYDIWVIDGPYGRLEIPAVDDYISKETAEETVEEVTLSLPRGFVEITGITNKSGRDGDKSCRENPRTLKSASETETSETDITKGDIPVDGSVRADTWVADVPKAGTTRADAPAVALNGADTPKADSPDAGFSCAEEDGHKERGSRNAD